ncbi:MAG: acetate/propionate family kinase [Verrucomicrobiae bacterium]|nr:acetate/propionate family kinase [Verrucomicrobiae bacterium]
MNILTLNCGSSSLKFALFEDNRKEALRKGEISWANGKREHSRLSVWPENGREEQTVVAARDDQAAAGWAIKTALGTGRGRTSIVDVVGHRIVHGGIEFRESTLVDERVKAAVAKLGQLAPLHNPPALKAIEAAESIFPGVPQVAVFDTAFYAFLEPKAYVYPLPYGYYKHWGIRRFGFHGISHAYCAARAAELLRRPLAELNLIICHLGGGCSATAVRGGKAIATTTGFSPLDGLMMGTRPGSLDPGILIALQQQHGLTLEEIEHALSCSSGLLGVSGISPDLAEIETAADRGDERAQLAFEMFADRVRSAIGGLAVTLGSLDALIFTDRIGETSPALRARVCAGLELLGLQLDRARNGTSPYDIDIATPGSRARLLAIHTQEELMIAREAGRIVNAAGVGGLTLNALKADPEN